MVVEECIEGGGGRGTAVDRLDGRLVSGEYVEGHRCRRVVVNRDQDTIPDGVGFRVRVDWGGPRLVADGHRRRRALASA